MTFDKNKTFYIELLPRTNLKTWCGTARQIEKDIEESNKIKKAMSKYRDDNNKHADLDYYTSKEFNLFEIVHFLKEHPDCVAKDREGNEYVYTDNGLKLGVYNERISSITPSITDEFLNKSFSLVPPQPKEGWVDISLRELLNIIIKDEAKTIRVIYPENTVCEISKEEIRDLSIDQMYKYKWQNLKDVVVNVTNQRT